MNPTKENHSRRRAAQAATSRPAGGLHRYATRDPETGRRQVFDSRLSSTAFRDWELNRRRLRREGYPDRPPEIDTPRLRAWTGPDGLASAPDRIGLGFAPEVDALGSWVTGFTDADGFRLTIGRRDDGTFLVRSRHVGDPNGYGFEFPDEVSLAAAVETWKSRLMMVGWPEPVWVSAEGLLAEIETARSQ